MADHEEFKKQLEQSKLGYYWNEHNNAGNQYKGLVYTILRSVSRSGMSRVIDCLIVNKDGSISNIGASVAEILNRKYDHQKEGIKTGGCGMDMGFELVYSLSQKLYGDGYLLKQLWL